MNQRRNVGGLNLAFLDVMACGLGAVILLFLIVKHNVTTRNQAPEIVAITPVELGLESLEKRKQEIKEKLADIKKQYEVQARANKEATQKIATTLRAVSTSRETIEQTEQKNVQLNKTVAEVKAIAQSDVIEDASVGEEKYLLGLRVEGKRIALLLDHSSSMTDELLLNIVRRKIGSDADKQKGPKWLRTLKVARWFLNRVPADSRVTVIAFNDKAKVLGSSSWTRGDDSAAIQNLAVETLQLVPTGSTNLHAALSELRRLTPQVTDVYLVTDGLPTAADSSVSRRVRCATRGHTITGKCRLSLLKAALRDAAPRSRSVKVNVILLPIEGDPDAVAAFAEWTRYTGGLTMAPAASWP